jgi:hypothetical protein
MSRLCLYRASRLKKRMSVHSTTMNKTGAESEGGRVEAKVGSKSMPIKLLLETYLLYKSPQLTSSEDHRSESRISVSKHCFCGEM